MTAPATRTVRLVSGDEVTIPESLVGPESLHTDNPRFVGMSPEGWVVVEAYGLRYGLTPCCGASAKGSMVGDEPAIVCRACYAEVDPLLGGEATVNPDDVWQPDEDPIDPESLGLVLDAATERVEALRATAKECAAMGSHVAAERFYAKASRLAEAVGNLRQIG